MSGKITTFKDLVAWQKGHEMVLLTYRLTSGFPAAEKFGLTDQMRRAAVSVTSCLAEGFSRKTNKDKLNFYKMATGSLTELDNQMLIAKDLHYLAGKEYLSAQALIDTTGRLISGLCKATQQHKYDSYADSRF